MLFIVATPIGNKEDLSAHAREILSSVDFILCEDTRRTKRLLSDCGLVAPQLISCHAHNEQKRVQRALQEIKAGKKAALVSDAGTPAISDPGAIVVEQAHQAGILVSPAAGASAVAAAISVSGFSSPPYHFLGFSPRKQGKRRDWIIALSQLQGITVLFEAGNRFGALISDLQALMPERELCLCRELTKTHQEITRRRIADFEAQNVLGEVTIVIGPGAPIERTVEKDKNMKIISLQLAKEWGISKREAYNLIMTIKPE